MSSGHTNKRCFEHMKSGACTTYVTDTIMGLYYCRNPTVKMALFAFGTTDWSTAEPAEHASETNMAVWHMRYFGDEPDRIRIRMVEYAPSHLADHRCREGYTLFCLDGELETTLEDGHTFMLTLGMSYQVGDDAGAYQLTTRKGA